MPQSKILYMAGIWQPTAKEKQFTILTTSPNDSVSPVHDRMPLVLTSEEIIPWIQSFDAADTSVFGAQAGVRAVVTFYHIALFDLQNK